MNIKEGVGFYLHQKEILARFEEWGYLPRRMSAHDMDENGYWLFQTQNGGMLMLNEEGSAPLREHKPWKSLEHWYWLNRTVQEIQGGN